MSLDLAQLDALMSRDKAADLTIDPHRRDLASAGLYGGSSTYDIASAYSSGSTAASPWHGGVGMGSAGVSLSHAGGGGTAPSYTSGGRAASYTAGGGGAAASYSAISPLGSVLLPPAVDDLGLPRRSLPGRKGGLTRSVPSLHGRKAKAQPRNTDATWDVETLQELVMSYKRKVSELDKARRLLRSQCQKAQERVLAKDREIDSILQKVAGGAALISEKSMIRSLKQQVRTLQDSLSEKTAEIEKLRGMVKFTQLEEMRIYCEDFAQELRRLRLFNELGRTAEAHVTIPALEEIRSLRQECGVLRRDNADLANRLTQAELSFEQSRARDRKQFAERIQKMEGELKQERALVAEMEKISDLTRAELAQVVAQTDTTRVALADSSTQIRILRERIASQEAELQLQKAAAANAAEKAAKDLADLLSLKESMERKLLAELAELHETLERQRAANSTLQESERLLQATVSDLKRVNEETKQKVQEEQRRLLDRLQQNENQRDVMGVEKKAVEEHLTSAKAELEQSTVALRQSQQNYEQARAELFALEKELQKVRTDAELANAARIAEMAKQEAELQAQQREVERLRALNEVAAIKQRADLDEALVHSETNVSNLDKNVERIETKPEIKEDDSAKLDDSPHAAIHEAREADEAALALPSREPVEDTPTSDAASDEPTDAGSEPVKAAKSTEVQPEETESAKKPSKERRSSKSRTEGGDKGISEKTEKHSGKAEKSREKSDKERSDKDKTEKSSSKTEKRSDKKPSTKRVGSKPA